MRRFSFVVACTLVLVLCGATALGQQRTDTLKVDYFANANTTGAPDATLQLTNPGTAGGNVCASIFVFDPMQELSECCSCLLSPDGLRTLSVNKDLTSQPLTGVTLTTGTIRIVSTAPVGGACPYPTNMTPARAVRSWATHIQNGSFTVTETSSQDATLSADEVKRLDAECRAILLGTHDGFCSCGTGD